jgi:microcystin-dependent protein
MFCADGSSGGRMSIGFDATRLLSLKQYTLNKWSHYAIVRKDGTFTVYEDGVNIGSTSDFLSLNVDLSNLALGQNSETSVTAYKGYIDDFVIYDRALYVSDFVPSETIASGYILYSDFENESEQPEQSIAQAWEITDIIGINDQSITIDPVEYVNTSSGIEDAPVGHIISHMGTVAPKHYLICDGAEYNIADYPYLVQHIKDNFGSVNYFGGDGESTFAVPDLANRFLQGSDTPGVYQEPGLPNITANWKSEPSADPQGAVTVTDENGNLMAVTSGGKLDSRLWFDASLSSAIYGNSETVTPANISVLYCIKYEPTYYMQIHQTNYIQSNVYSEEEQVVGRWIDGKPIYRRTLAGVITTSGTMLLTNANNIEKLIRQHGYFWNASYTSHGPIPWFHEKSSNRCFIGVSADNNVVCVNGNVLNCEFFVTIEYTKTTDEPNSFTNDMIQDYVTTEPYPDEEVTNVIDTLWQ